MSFGAAFSGFAQGFVSGYEKAENIEYKRAVRDYYKAGRSGKAKEDPRHTGAISDTHGQMSRSREAPEFDEPEEGYADGGAVPLTSPQGHAMPSVDPEQRPENPYSDEEIEAGAAFNSQHLQPTMGYIREMASGGQAIPADQPAPQAQEAGGLIEGGGFVQKLMSIFNPKEYPDLTTTVGGIRAVTKAPADRPFQTGDHLKFLSLYEQNARRRGVDPTQIMQYKAQYLDNLRYQSNRIFGLAAAAWDDGDAKAVQHFVQQGYGMIPDGMGVKTSFKDGKLTIQQTDERTGKPVGKPQVMDRNGFMRTVGKVTGTTFSFAGHLNDMTAPGRTRGAGGPGSRGGTVRTPAVKDPWVSTIPTNLQTQFRKDLGDEFKDAKARSQAERIFQHMPRGSTSAQAAEVAKNVRAGTWKMDDEKHGVFDENGALKYKINPGFFPKTKPAGQAAAPAQETAPAAPAAPGNPGAGFRKGLPAKPDASAPAISTPAPATSGSAMASSGEQAPEETGIRKYIPAAATGRELGNTVRQFVTGEGKRSEPAQEAVPTETPKTSSGVGAVGARVKMLEAQLSRAKDAAEKRRIRDKITDLREQADR